MIRTLQQSLHGQFFCCFPFAVPSLFNLRYLPRLRWGFIKERRSPHRIEKSQSYSNSLFTGYKHH